MMTLGSDDQHEMETLMDEEIEVVHHEHSEVAHALQTMADGMPALGIVAAVLGVIKTMGSITEPPEILGKLIGGALVGTFLGVWLSRSDEHTSELQSLMRISYAVFCLKKNNTTTTLPTNYTTE